MSIEFDVRIENIYEDPLDESPDAMVATFKDAPIKTFKDAPIKNVQVEVPEPNIAAVTLTVEVPDMPEEFASDEEWDEWAEEMIFPFTGIGHEEGNTGYFAEITECRHTEYQHAIGKTFEWGV